jgi:hypothetical protein
MLFDSAWILRFYSSHDSHLNVNCCAHNPCVTSCSWVFYHLVTKGCPETSTLSELGPNTTRGTDFGLKDYCVVRQLTTGFAVSQFLRGGTNKFSSVDAIYTTPPPATPSPLSVKNSPSSLLSQSPVNLFTRGIKRDFSAIPTLKGEKNNDQWHCTFTTMARAQDLSDVRHPKYVPSLLIFSGKIRSLCTLYLKLR